MTGDREDLAIGKLADRGPGEDPEEVYEDVNIEQLPDWWQNAIREHKAFKLRPYRPPRFTDGTYLPPLIQGLEQQFDVDVNIRGKNVTVGEEWTVMVDGTPAFNIGHRRDPNGYSVYEMSAEEFCERIRASLDTGSDG